MLEIIFEVSRVLSIVAFLFYGTLCLLSNRMVEEFERYGLASVRKLVGSLEVAGALGLLAGYFVPVLVLVGSLGLTLLMIMGVATRIRIRDSLLATSPAVFLALVNGFVFVHALTH